MPRYDSSDGSAPYYEDYPGVGEGTPVILLAGGAARHPSYMGDLAGLGEEHRLIVPHLRGVGLTEAPSDPEQGSWWRQAVDVEQLRSHLGLDRVTLIAHSAGVTSTEDDFSAWQRDSAAAGYATWNETARTHAQIGRWSLAAATAYFSVDPPQDLAAQLREMTAPVLVIAAAQDCLAGVEPVKALAHSFPAGQSVTIEACGHYPWVEQPAAFRRVMHTFLERPEQLTSDAQGVRLSAPLRSGGEIV